MGGFLDTTAMTDLLFKDKATADRVRSATAELGNTYTSQYVRMEIKRGVLQNFVLIYNKSVECQKISEIFAYVHRLSSTPARHRTSTILEALTNFFASIEENELAGQRGNLSVSFNKRMVEAFLRTRIRRFWVEFERQVDVVIDSVECYKNGYQLPPPKFVGTRIDNTFKNCDQYKPQICVVRQFLRANMQALTSIREQLKSDPSPDGETQKRCKAIKDFVRWQGRREVRRTDCWHIGDAIIALEAPNQTAIVNNNRRHMDPICTAIGKPSVGY